MSVPPRTTKDAVVAILTPGGDYDGTSDLTPFIAAASDLVDQVLGNFQLSRTRIALSSVGKVNLETWLAAAMYAFSDQTVRSRNTGKASGQFQGNQDGAFLETNKYGRMACMIDTSRILKPLVEGRIAGIVWLGKVPSNQIPYDQRN